MEKYNETKERIKLAEIKANQPPEFLMTEEQLKDSIMANLPKSTMCPIHELSMELSEGISKKGEHYRLYKCCVSGCDQKLWTEREADTINAEVKDIEAFLGIENTKDILPGQLRKEKQIEKYANRRETADELKQKAIKESSVLRDSAMFAVAEYGDPNNKLSLTGLHEKWMKYFKEIYQ